MWLETFAKGTARRRLSLGALALSVCALTATLARATGIEVRLVQPAFDTTDPEPCARAVVSWSNAWRDERNHDAAWVFVKARASGGTWRHVLLDAAGHAGTPVTHGGPQAEISVSPDRVGAFVRCAAGHRGPVSWDLTLALDELTLSERDPRKLELRVFALEMVWIPGGRFFVGDTDPDSAQYSTFFRSGPDGERAGVLEISSERAIEVGPHVGALWYEVHEDQAQYGGDRLGPVPSEFPKGFDALYAMKYEISQGEYASFLETLPPAAASVRAIHAMPGYRARRGTIALVDDHYVATSPRRPCNFISWDDGCAYADWAGLRPMTELEYVKACRGPREPTDGEYPWGTRSRERLARIVRPDDDLESRGEADESRLEDSTRDVLGASYYGVLDLAGSVWERCVTIGHARGRAFRGTHGDGRLELGWASNEDWPRGDAFAGGFGYRGGGYYEHGDAHTGFNPWSPIEWRRFGSWGEAPRSLAYGFRGVRSTGDAGTSPARISQLPAASRARAVDRARAAVRRFLAASRAPGLSVAVAIRGDVVWSEGFGHADLEQLVAVTPRTRFGIGSISKALTCAALAVLVERGALDLDAPLERYLTDFPHPGKGVTARLVASHLSGLSDDWASALYETTQHFGSTRAAAERGWAEPMVSSPGARTQYGTGTYTLLALLIEERTGKSYADAMRELVIEPLGLDDTTLNVRSALVPRRTRFYVRDDRGRVVHAPFVDPSFKYAGAGFLSSAQDVASFASALTRPGFLRAETLETLFAPVARVDGSTGPYALAWRVTRRPDGSQSFDVPGGGLGISSYVRVVAGEPIVLAILSNLTGAQIEAALGDEIEAAFRENR